MTESQPYFELHTQTQLLDKGHVRTVVAAEAYITYKPYLEYKVGANYNYSCEELLNFFYLKCQLGLAWASQLCWPWLMGLG